MHLKHNLSLIIPLLALASAQAALIVHEPFDYSAGATGPDPDPSAAVAGGTGLVYSSMRSGRAPVRVSADGLEFTSTDTLAVSGRAAEAPGGTSWIYKLQLDDLPADFEAIRDPANLSALGAPGTSIWFSFLLRVEGSVDNQTEAALNISKSRIKLGLTGNERSDAPYIRVSGPRSEVVVESGTTYLIVGRMTYGEKMSPDERTDNVEIWVNPEIGPDQPDQLPAARIDGTLAILEDFWFETNVIGTETTVVFDEIRIGETYLDVTPAKD